MKVVQNYEYCWLDLIFEVFLSFSSCKSRCWWFHTQDSEVEILIKFFACVCRSAESNAWHEFWSINLSQNHPLKYVNSPLRTVYFRRSFCVSRKRKGGWVSVGRQADSFSTKPIIFHFAIFVHPKLRWSIWLKNMRVELQIFQFDKMAKYHEGMHKF